MEKYKPSSEEVAKAEGMMTDEQKGMSEQREKESYKPTQEEVKTAEGMMSSSERASSQTREQLLVKYKELGFDEKTLEEFLHSAKAFWDEGINFNVRGHEVKFWGGSNAKGIREEIQEVLNGNESNLNAYGFGAEVDGEWIYGEQAVKLIKKYGPLVLPFLELQSSSVKKSAGESKIDDLLE